MGFGANQRPGCHERPSARKRCWWMGAPVQCVHRGCSTMLGCSAQTIGESRRRALSRRYLGAPRWPVTPTLLAARRRRPEHARRCVVGARLHLDVALTVTRTNPPSVAVRARGERACASVAGKQRPGRVHCATYVERLDKSVGTCSVGLGVFFCGTTGWDVLEVHPIDLSTTIPAARRKEALVAHEWTLL